MKYEELKGLSADQLKEKEAGLRKELFNLRFQQASGELENTSRFAAVRKDIARIATYRNEQKKAA
jgi:large subunit ribosomal protein L29